MSGVAIMTCGPNISELLFEVDLAYEDGVHHSQACVSEDNREGDIATAVRIQWPLLITCNKGYANVETKLALAKETSVGEAGEVTNK